MLSLFLPKSAWSQLQIAAFLAIPATKMQATWRGFYRRKKFLTMKRSGMRDTQRERGRDIPPAAPKAIPIFLLTFIQCIISLKTHIPALMPHWKLFISRVGFPEHFWCQFCVQSFWGWRSSLNAKSFVLFLAITIQSWWRGTLGRRKAAKRKWAVETIRRCVKSSPSLQTSHSLTIRC